MAMKTPGLSVAVSSRKRVGLLVPATNLVAEDEIQDVLSGWPMSVQRPVVHVSRVRFSTPFASDPRRYLSELASNAIDAMQALPLSRIDAVGFCCSSSSTLFADQLDACAKIPLLTPYRSVLAAVQSLAIRRVVLVTPYPAEIGCDLAASFSKAGLKVVAQRHLGLRHGEQYVACDIDDDVRSLITEAEGRVDGALLSCTNIGTLSHIQTLEGVLGIPVLSSNASLIWALLRSIDIDTSMLPILGVLGGAAC